MLQEEIDISLAEFEREQLLNYDFEDYEDDEEDRYYNPDYYENVGGVMLERQKDETKAKNYVNLGLNKYGYVDEVIQSIPAGFYRPCYDNYNQKAFLEKRNVTLPKLYKVPDETFELIYNDIQHFWKSEEKYKAFGNVYKRNILLYSVPGNGKTSLINMLAFDLVNQHNGIIVTINSSEDLRAYSKNIEKIRMIEPNRKIITIIEDFDSIITTDKPAETLLLQLLDGNNQFGNIVTIATTNYVSELKPSFLNRPSRFNLCLEYKKPSEKVRRFYICNKLQDSGIDVSTKENNESIERLVKMSDGFTFDHMKELLELIYVGELSEEDAFKRIKDIVDAKGKYRITEDTSSVGFVNNHTTTSEPKPKVIGFGL